MLGRQKIDVNALSLFSQRVQIKDFETTGHLRLQKRNPIQHVVIGIVSRFPASFVLNPRKWRSVFGVLEGPRPIIPPFCLPSLSLTEDYHHTSVFVPRVQHAGRRCCRRFCSTRGTKRVCGGRPPKGPGNSKRRVGFSGEKLQEYRTSILPIRGFCA